MVIMRNIKQNEVELTLNMWGMSKSTIYRFRKNCKNGLITKFNNGMIFDPSSGYFGK